MKSNFRPCSHKNVPCANKSVGGFHLMKNEYSKQHLILQHMMSHYRRVYSAKCDVDTSTPICFKPRFKPKPRPPLPTPLLPIQSQLTRDDIRFLESLAGDIRSWWTGKEIRHPLQHPEPKIKIERETKSSRNLLQMPDQNNEDQEWDLYEQQCNPCKVEDVPALSVRTVSKNMKDSDAKRCSLACQSLASSKLREMSVYHPPRRKVAARDSRSSNKLCSQTSSRSSRKTSVSCSSGNYSRSCKLFANEVGPVIEQQKEELLYLQFVQDITQEILDTDIYCNDGVNRIFSKHIYLNRGKLRMEKMKKEVEKLRKQIGVPGSKCPLFCRAQKRLSMPTVVKEISKIIDDDGGKEEENVETPKKTKHCFSIPNRIYQFKGNAHNKKAVFKSTEKAVVEVEMKQECEPCEKTKKSNVLGLLQEMGFDNKMAEEICLCMTEKDISKFNFTSNETVPNDYWLQDFTNSSQPDEKDNQEKPKCIMDLYSGFLLGKDNTEKTAYFFSEKEVNDGRVSESLTTDRTDTTEDFADFLRTPLSCDGRNSKESGESASTFGVELGSDSDFMENSKSILSQEKADENVPASTSAVSSPFGSDYSSMKDNNESTYEESFNPEEPDEGRESISETEEEIPEELSQTSSSSGISQLTERLKRCTMNINTLLHSRSNERSNLPPENKTGQLKTLIL